HPLLASAGGGLDQSTASGQEPSSGYIGNGCLTGSRGVIFPGSHRTQPSKQASSVTGALTAKHFVDWNRIMPSPKQSNGILNIPKLHLLLLLHLRTHRHRSLAVNNTVGWSQKMLGLSSSRADFDGRFLS
ncbi:MAG: hypothetical protein VKI42_02775, partial [Synechococcaceae cyanobacterium]|nr:hypothetical protein [Synechococcaceae cyanobacterium]